jgi:hypothetical protein
MGHISRFYHIFITYKTLSFLEYICTIKVVPRTEEERTNGRYRFDRRHPLLETHSQIHSIAQLRCNAVPFQSQIYSSTRLCQIKDCRKSFGGLAGRALTVTMRFFRFLFFIFCSLCICIWCCGRGGGGGPTTTSRDTV